MAEGCYRTFRVRERQPSAIQPSAISHPAILALPLLAALTCLASARIADTVTRPFAGITYIDRTETSPRQLHMHVVQIDLRTPGLRFKVSPSAGPLEVVRQTTLDYLRE